MAHLFVDLFDRVGDPVPYYTLDDQDENNRLFFHDLNIHGAADRAARVRIRRGDEFRRGDHIRLMDRVRRSNTDTISVDPDVTGDVDLNRVIFNNAGFADRTAAVLIVTNPNQDGGFRLRVKLLDRVGQEFPTLILYNWEFPPRLRFADLNLFNFADKTAFIQVERGPNFRDGDRIILWDELKAGTITQTLEPGDFDLNTLVHSDGNWADKVAAIEFDLQPPV